MKISEIQPKKSEKAFSFLDNCIRIGCHKFSGLGKEYLSSAVNVLTSSPNISHITKRDISQPNFPQSDEKYDKSAIIQISAVFETL